MLGQLELCVNTETWTLRDLVEQVLKRRLGVNEPTVGVGASTLYEEGESADERLEANLGVILKVRRLAHVWRCSAPEECARGLGTVHARRDPVLVGGATVDLMRSVHGSLSSECMGRAGLLMWPIRGDGSFAVKNIEFRQDLNIRHTVDPH